MGKRRDFEFQRLYGMGEDLYDEITPADALGIPCRIYAPVGSHEDLLPYLVRRLLENGANTSFVNRIVDEKLPVADIVADPAGVHDRLSRRGGIRRSRCRDGCSATRARIRAATTSRTRWRGTTCWRGFRPSTVRAGRRRRWSAARRRRNGRRWR